MNAIQPSRPPLQSVSPLPKQLLKQPPKPLPRQRGASSRRRLQQQRKASTHQAIAFELSAKLVVNVVLTIAAASTLLKLVPYHVVQQEKLQNIQAEVANVEGRVANLRTDFSRQFDPQQTMSVMQEQSNRISPTQRRIVWSTPLDAGSNE